MAAQNDVPTPELLDPGIDLGHRSYLLAVEHRHLGVLRPHPPAEFLCLDPQWIGRYVMLLLISLI